MRRRRLQQTAWAAAVIAVVTALPAEACAKRTRCRRRACRPCTVRPICQAAPACQAPACCQVGVATAAPQVVAPQVVAQATPAPQAAGQPAPAGKPLFDGKTLTGWKPTQFGGEGEVKVENGAITMEFGYSITGITYDGKDPLPKTNYEISLEAQRVDGIDFFCGLTFPVEESHCSFIVGGWAGTVVGLSSIDGLDASENDTTKYMDFKKGQWYRIRVRVTEEHITAWIDDKQMVKQEVKGHRIGTRPEVDLNTPLGVCAFETKAALRNIRLRQLKAPGKAGGSDGGDSQPAGN